MESYDIGRYSLSLPSEISLIGRSHRIRSTEIEEIPIDKNRNREDQRKEIWDARIEKIKQINPGPDKSTPIIAQRRVEELGLWAKGILYRENWGLEDEVTWAWLVDYGPCLVWFIADGAIQEKENMEKVTRNLTELAKNYHPRINVGSFGVGPWFNLEYGAINQPYKWEEQAIARFEGHPLDLEVEVDMKTTYADEPKGDGLFGRTAAAIASGYMAGWGVKVKKIRAQERVVAGLKGEDQVIRLSSRSGKDYDFTWRFAGRKNSGEYPEIMISMRSPEGNLEEKLKIWDAILDSVKPLYKQPQ